MLFLENYNAFRRKYILTMKCFFLLRCLLKRSIVFLLWTLGKLLSSASAKAFWGRQTPAAGSKAA